MIALRNEPEGLILGARPTFDDTLASIENLLDGGQSSVKKLKGTLLIVPRDVLPATP